MNRMVKKLMVVLLSVFMFMGAVTTPVQAKGNSSDTNGWNPWGGWRWGWQQPTEPEPEPEITEEPVVEEEPIVEEEPVAEEEPEIVETPVEAAYPANEFSDKIGNTTVNVVVPEGALPEGTTMGLSEVSLDAVQDAVDSASDVEGTVVAAVDITFYKADGEVTEPLIPITVTMTSEEIAKVENPQVVHVDATADEIEDADVEAEAVEADFAEDTAVFEAEHFSVYAVIDGDSGENARAEVNFYNGDTLIATYYIKNSDVLLGDGERSSEVSYLEDIVTDPGVGTLGDKELFYGWATSETYTTETKRLTIEDVRKYLADNVIGNITEGDTVNIYAMIFKYYNITYYGYDYDEDENVFVSLGSDTVLLLPNGEEADYLVKMSFTPKANYNFEGWEAGTSGTYGNIKSYVDSEGETQTNVEEDTVYPNDTQITITGDVVFNAVSKQGNWLIFDQNGKGATYVAPKFIYTGDVTKDPTQPDPDNPDAAVITMTRLGYTFGGWYDTKAHADAHAADTSVTTGRFQFGSPIEGEDDITVYASWIPNTTAPYTVILWGQNIDRTGYEVFASYVNTNGTVGQNIPYTSVENGDEDYATGVGDGNGHYTGFCLKEDSKNQQVEITPEGDAVLNLYYDRIEYNFKFYLYRDGTQQNRYDYADNSGSGSTLNDLVTWHSNQTEHPSVSGRTIQSETVGGRTYYYFVMQAYYGEDISEKWPKYNEITGANNHEAVSFVMMVGTKLKPNPTNQGSGTVKGVITTLNENILGATNNANGNYVMIRFPDSYYNWRYHIWFETIAGEDYSGKNTYTYNGKTYYEETVQVVRSSNTTDANQNEPKYTGFDYQTRVGQNNQGVWGGGHWTTTENGTTLYHLNYIYNRQVYKINYFDGNYVDGNGNTVQNRGGHPLEESPDIPQGAIIADEYRNYIPNLPEGEKGYVFAGWYLDEGCTVAYPWNKMPVGGITVYAKWQQIQYRVFLHPNAETENTNPELDWGSDNQAMNFRISYGSKVSLPTGRWTGGTKEFIGWYTSPDCNPGSYYTENTLLNEKTVTTPYDQTDTTDPLDKWGQIIPEGTEIDDGNGNKIPAPAPYNSDQKNNRTWITEKLDLYALWRTVLVGADGITVVYNATDTSKDISEDDIEGTVNGNQATYTDPILYLDQAGAIATAASTPDDNQTYQFLYWVIQEWNGSEYVDVIVDNKLKTVFPGDNFKVLEDYAKIVDNNTGQVVTTTEADGSYTYTVQLRAEYGLTETPTPTHITWYGNGGTLENAVVGVEDKYGATSGEVTTSYIDLQINEKVPAAGANTFERSGYKFVGWAKVDEPAGAFDSETKVIDESKYSEVESDSLVLWLEYDEANSVFNELDENGDVINEGITEVAADEKLPYHALYAVWEHKYFYVFHSSDATLEAIALPDTETFNIVNETNDGTLYGGYYSAYVDLNADSENVVAAKANAVQAENKTAAVENAPTYDGSLLKPAGSSVKFWVKANAWTEAKLGKGNSIPVSGINEGDVFFLKEVPEAYLKAYTSYVYDYNTLDVKSYFLITAIDDSLYQEVGYYIEEILAANKNPAKIAASFSYRQRNSAGTLTTIKPNETYFEGVKRGYLGFCDVSDIASNYYDKGLVMTKPYWVTLDGVEITNDTCNRTVKFAAKQSDFDYTGK